MKKEIKTLLWALIIAVVLTVVFYLAFPWLTNREFIEKKIVSLIEERIETPFSYGRSEIAYFPNLAVRFKDVSVAVEGERKLEFKAETLGIRVKMLPLLLGKVRVSQVQVQNGMIAVRALLRPYFRDLTVEKVDVNLSGTDKGASMRFDFSGQVAGNAEAISGQGVLDFDLSGNWDWKKVGLHGKLSVAYGNLAELMDSQATSLPVRIGSGKVMSQLQFLKVENENGLKVTGAAKLSGFVFETQSGENVLKSPQTDFDFNFESTWDATTEELLLRKVQMHSPIGNIEINGQIFLGTGEVREIRVTAGGMSLEKMPEYWVLLKEAMPMNIGFSGQSDWDISVKGTPDHLALNGNVDLNSATLTYAGYFSKPKDVPMNISLDLVLLKAKTLSGDFSTHVMGAIAKGTLTNFDLWARKGQCNIITNKFSLAGWEKILPLLQKYHLGGEIKLLANWEKGISESGGTKTVLNVTVGNGTLTNQNNQVVKDINFTMDYDTTSFVLKQANFNLAGFPVSADFSMYGIGENPLIKGKLGFQNFEPLAFWEAFQEFSTEWLSADLRKIVETEKAGIIQAFPRGERIDNFLAEAHYQQQKLFVDKLNLKAYGGDLNLKGQIRNQSGAVSYEAELDIRKLDLERYLGRGGNKAPIQGQLFCQAKARSDKPQYPHWVDTIEGEGTFLITEGKIPSVDLTGLIAAIPEFKDMETFASGSTAFDDIHARFGIKTGKMTTDKLVMVSPALFVQGRGDMAIDGTLNYRLDMFLSKEATRKVIGPILGDSGEQQFGPIPFILTGTVAEPKLQIDSQNMPELLRNLEKKKSHKVLRNFLPEETLFDLASTS